MMDDILEKLSRAAGRHVKAMKEIIPPDQMRELAEEAAARDRSHASEPAGACTAGDASAVMAKTGFPFEQALARDGISFICECKRASPSRGLIAPDFPYLDIAKDYEQAGADAISVLTEPEWFMGNDLYLRQIADRVTIPCLRKDFTVDEYMIYQAKVLGASAVLLICAILEQEQLKAFIRITHSLGMSALVEAHDSQEIREAAEAGARIIGVNNRNLKNFTVDVSNAAQLRSQVPEDILFVAESGIRTPEDVRRLRDAGADAVLVGETMMRAPDKTGMLRKLRTGEPETENGSRSPEKRSHLSESHPVSSEDDPLFPENRSLSPENCFRSAVKIKTCGLKSEQDIANANRLHPDYIGFILAPQFPKRYVAPEQAAELKKKLDSAIQAVGVFVNQPADLIVSIAESGTIDMIQLHGEEDDDYIREIQTRTGRPVIKAFRIRTREDLAAAMQSTADYLLLDNGPGTGETFDWSLLESEREKITRPFFLAGGIRPGNAAEAIRRVRPYALDASSGIEKDGRKDACLMEKLIREVRSAETGGAG